MRRRDLFGYSLLFSAGGVQAQTVKPDFDRVAPPERFKKMAEQEPHMALVELETDVLVAGGGLAGVCAAISAARHGAKVVLVQDRSRLGGNSSSEVKMHVVGANSHRGRPGWRDSGLVEEIRLDDAANNPQRCWELWDLLLYDKVVSEPNITLLLESVLYAADLKDGGIQQVMVRCDKSEHLYRIKAKVFCDCTGDSRLALESNAEMRWGREQRAEFGESLAPVQADKETLGSSILFTSRLYQKPMPFTAPSWARKITKEQLKFRKIDSWEYGYWWIEWGGNLNTIRDNEKIRFELLSITMGIWDYIKNSGEFPDAKHWAMDWVGMMPGRRGSRRIVGDHMLTEHDLLQGGTEFPDAVAIGGWPMDDHPPGGFDRSDLPPNTVLRTKEVYNIPLRSLYSKNVKNLMMAGRNISATHAAFTSTRVMATCAVIGQAVGTAAAACVENRVLPRQLAQNQKLVTGLQQRLLRDDQTIRGVKNQDPLDLAKTAKVTASGCQGDCKPELILDGVTRDIPETKQIHHWAAPLTADGAWVELAWDKPQKIGQVELTFDSGFQRELTLSSSDTVSRGIVRAPQPETAKDYDVLVKSGSEWKPLVSVKGNHQRLRKHRVDPVTASALRVHVKATNGDDLARIFEIRCYT